MVGPAWRLPKKLLLYCRRAEGAFWTVAPAALAPPQWRALAYGASFVFGLTVGLLRMAAGGHFFSDVAFAGVLTFLVIWVAHGCLYRWVRTRISEEAMEATLQRMAKAPRDVLRRLGLLRRQVG